MEDYLAWVWLGITVLFVLLEGATPQLIAIWFAGGSVAALILALVGVPFWIQLFVFVGVSFLLLASTRPFLKKYLKIKKVSTNADRFVGQTGVVTKTINNLAGEGMISIFGQSWTARSADSETIAEGETVQVERIEGVKLIVSKK